MGLTVEQIIAAFATAAPSITADYDIVTVDGAELRVAHLAVSRRGFPALLVPVPRVDNNPTRLTHGVAVSAAAGVEFARTEERWRRPAAVLECRDPRLMR